MIRFILMLNGKLSRKTFLTGMASGLLASGLEGAPGSDSNQVLIIGAGMAGLAAGEALQRQGFKVTILEGRNRVGGRIWTDRSTGSPIDLGASWIHGSRGNPITSIARRLKLNTKRTNFESLFLYGPDGKPIKDKRAEEIWSEFNSVLKAAFKLARRQDRDISVLAAVQKVIGDEKLTRFESQALQWGLSTLEMATAAPVSKLSTWADSDAGFGGDDYLFPDGYDRVPLSFARKLTIKQGVTVQRVAQSANGVEVSTTRGVFRAHYALITVPLGVLRNKRIQFSPPLPPKKQLAIDGLEMGLLHKSALVFNKSFWPQKRDFLGYISPKWGKFPVFMNCKKFSGQNALMGFCAADYAHRVERGDLESRGRAREPLQALDKIYGSKMPYPTHSISSSWAWDPFSYGSYSYIPVGGKTSWRDDLAAPFKRIFFAGEATHNKYPATVHGAYLSGLREARRIGKL